MKKISLLALSLLLLFNTYNLNRVFADDEENIELTGVAR